MKLKLNKKELLESLNIVTKVIPKNATLPIIEYLLFDFVNESGTKYIALRATNLHNTITNYIYYDFDDSMSNFLFMEPIKLKSFLEKTQDQEFVEFKFNKSEVVIKIGKDKIKLNIQLDTSDFPKFPEVNEQNAMTINYKEFKDIINKTFTFTDDDELRPVMSAIHLNKLDDESFDFVSTNANMLIKLNTKNISFEGEDDSIKINIHKSIKLLLPNSKVDNIEIKGGEKYIEFNIDNTIIHSIIIEGNYPSYNSVIPTNNPHEVIFNKAELISALGKSSLVENVAGMVKLSIKENKAIIQSEDIDFNNSFNTEIEINSKISNDDDIDLGFKNKFMTNILKSIDGEEVKLSYSIATSAMLLSDTENDNILYLLMPMLLN